ncbi:MAG: NAD(P)H-dependent oxidoreductase [Oligoflexia bacterium]|nr:NAD(P)H-dependent oxidoreductase [Oligoflexia bacterium]
MKKVLIISATSGNNLKLANAIKEVGTKIEGVDWEVVNLEDFDLPVYTSPGEGKGIPADALKLTDMFTSCAGYLVLAPEYNGSIPPIVTNAVAWISRSGNEDWRASFNGKFAVVGTHSGGGGLKVCQAMRAQFEHLGSVVLPRNILTNYQKQMNPESVETILTQFAQYL